MNKLFSANYWFDCDWGFYEVGYLGLGGGQLSLAVVYLWNTGYLRVTCPRLYPGIQQRTAFVNEYQEDGKIIIKFVKSEDNEVDIFTKNTSNIICQRHQEKLVWDKKEVIEDK